jgi:alpha-1,2-mannosyltransferase
MTGAKRGIKHPWAYMLLGQLVAVSFSTGLFITASTLRPRSRQIDKRRIWLLLVPLAGAMATIYRQPSVVGTSKFMPNLLAMHGLLLLPLFFSPRATTPPPTPAAQTVHGLTRAEIFIYTVLGCAAALIHKVSFDAFEETLGSKPFFKSLWYLIFSHPAQGSISFDVISVIVTLFFWGLTTGSWTSLFLKSAVLAICSAAMWISETGVNWTLVASIVPIGGLASFGVLSIALGRLRKNNEVKRKELLDKMGIIEENVVPGTDKKPPAYAPRRTVVGFWHPYW